MATSTTEVVNRSLRALAVDARDILAATAPCSNTRDENELSLAFFTKEGKMITHGRGSTFLTGLLPSFLKSVLQHFPLHTISPGDFIIANDPYSCGSSLPVIMGVSPVYFDKRPLALVASALRHPDVGGSAPGAMPASARDIFQEGLRFSPIKAFHKGLPNDGLLALLSSNARSGNDICRGIKAQYWTAKSAEKMISGLAAKYGPERLKKCLEEIIEGCRRRIAAVLQSWPDKEFSGSFAAGRHPVSGEELKIQVSVKKDDQYLYVDFTGTSSQAPVPVNSALGTTLSCVYSAAGAALEPCRPLNHGLLDSIKITVPEYSLLNPGFPAPVSCSHITAQSVHELVAGSLAGLAGVMPSGGSGGAARFTVGGFRSENNSFYSFCGAIAAGQGASPHKDGESTFTADIFATSPASVEKLESACPVMVNAVSLVKDSGGAGKFRGGPAMEWSLSVLEEETVISAGAGPAMPAGNGGLPGSMPSISVSRSPLAKGLLISEIYTGHPGQGGTVTIRTAGGGGFGSPRHREPEKVRKDVLEGLVSPTAAREVYRVALSGPDLKVDIEATARLRGEED